jgi:hypothetical protein|tara:strand:- start:239 stop:448 length:210 start_codon:yes stop_codon:yes gene_type:complete
MSKYVSSCCGKDFQDLEDEDRFQFYKCDYCCEEFDEPMNDYDYDDLKKDEREEMEADEYRTKMAKIPFG